MAATDGWGRTQIAGLLLGDPVDGVDRMSASADLGRWSENDPTAGLPDYLLAKNLYATQNYRAAELHLRRSLARPSELESVRRESLRIGTFLACALENRAAVQSRGQTYDELPGVSKARRAGMKRFVRRCLDNG